MEPVAVAEADKLDAFKVCRYVFAAKIRRFVRLKNGEWPECPVFAG
jgi:hypothetical protein